MPSREFHVDPLPHLIDAHTHGNPDPSRVTALRSFHLEEVGSRAWKDAPFRCLGLHPWFVDATTLDLDLGLLEEIARRGDLVALGETGLDRVRGPDLALQRRAMEGHVVLSESLRLPLVVHCVRTGADLLQLRKSSRASRPWILHGWNGSREQTQQVLESGCVPSFGASLLREGSPTRGILAGLPEGAFLLETDDAPVDISVVEAEAVALRGTDSVTLREQLHRTWVKVFGEVSAG